MRCILLMTFFVFLFKHKKSTTYLPFYGGAKGQTLQVTEFENGTVVMQIIKTPEERYNQTSFESTHPSELEMPSLPHRQTNADYKTNLKNIHQTALNIIRLQEKTKEQKHIDDKEYRENLDNLSVAAENLAKLQEGDEEDLFDFNSDVGLSPWFERKKNIKKDKDKKKEEEHKKKEEERKKKEEEEERKRKEAMEKEQEKEEEEENNESVAVELPPEDASVAEAKPVGLAIAGVGGVAASKPVATAVVGPGGLAVARPVGTAIAGVSPDQALVPIYAEDDSGSSKKGNKEDKKKPSTSEYLNRIIHRYHQV